MPMLTREGLYELVWSKTMRDAAKEVGTSNVSLSKRCREIDVPIPPQGHWNKIRAGKRSVKRPPLPPRPPGVSDVVFGNETKEWTEISVRMEVDERFAPVPPHFGEDSPSVRRRIEAVVRPVKVTKHLQRPHPAIDRVLRHDERTSSQSPWPVILFRWRC